MKLKTLLYALGIILALLLVWNIYLIKTNSNLLKNVQELKDNFHYLESYNKVIEYDRTIAQDSVRILRESIQAFENKTDVP